MATNFHSLLLLGGPWHDGTQTLTYSFNASMSATEIDLMQQAVNVLNDVANINMVRADVGEVGDLEFHSVADNSLFGYAYAPSGGVIGTPSIDGDVFISNVLPDQVVNEMGHTSWNTYIHELGHALGLSHPNDDPSNTLGDPTNNNQYTMMSYVEHPSVSGLPLIDQGFGLTPMIYDIEALQHYYGANTSHLDGNTTYFGAGTGPAGAERAFQDDDMLVDVNSLPMIVAIWDGGGIDTIDASIVDTNSIIRLTNGTFSTIGTTANNVCISSAVRVDGVVVNLIENAIGGGGNDTINGNGGNNSIIGKNGNDKMSGGLGNDTLNGGLGNDTMTGGKGNDIYYVNSAGDDVDELIGQGAGDSVMAFASFALAANDNIEWLSTSAPAGASAINLTGNILSQHIVGNAGVNHLSGMGGSDTLTGGQGADFFVFSSALGATNIDRITDFNTIADHIQLENTRFGNLANGVLDAVRFVANAAGRATTAAQRIVYDTNDGFLYFDADGNKAGGVAAIHFATLATHPAGLSNSDFILI